jgi:hypothetical protein
VQIKKMHEITLVEWQRVSPVNNLVQCWFTHPCLDWMEQQDWTDKKVLQYGSGLGDAWLAKKSKYLISIERNNEWAMRVQEYVSENNIDNYELHYRPLNDGENQHERYIKLPVSYNTQDVFVPDVIIVDDAYRLECIKYAISLKRNLILVVDNWMQSYVFLNTEARDILEPYEKLIFEQKDHKDNDGVNKWKTGVFFLKHNT